MLHDSGKPFSEYVDAEAGTVDRIIFSDQAIYELELERIFARCWNFMCHESQIPNKGDFFLSFIGEESVICTRDKTGALQVFLNTCRHRGNAVCRAESGNARSFLCTYHGWTYGLDGKLIGVPGYKDLYHEDLDREQWGLVSAGKVASYKGFVFATMDPEAPDLDEYLGEVGRMGIDMMAARGKMIAVEGVQKNQITCNWKLAVDNLFDFYHPQISHASAYMSEFRKPSKNVGSPGAMNQHRVVLGDYGHAIGGPRLQPERLEAMDIQEGLDNPLFDQTWRKRVPTAAAELGPVGMETAGHPNIFPNLWVSTAGTQLSLRLPKGPALTEIWWFTLLEEGLPEHTKTQQISSANHNFGPAGMLEQDDGENWDQSTRQTMGVVARRYPLHFAMGRGHDDIQTVGGIPHVNTVINEHAQLWTYRAWANWMDAESWASLKQSRTPVPATGKL